MTEKSIQLKVKLDNLVLDKNNPRFAELYSGSDKEDEIIEYLLYTESAEDIANAISQAGEFYPDRPLWVLKDGDKYIVKDGNRRCASVKALKHPSKYGLEHLNKFVFEELPVLLYHNEEDLNTRIRQEHTSNLFRQWGRIAKALEIHRLYNGGSSIESMSELDSSPTDIIKLASFYYEAVKIGGDDFKKLLRTGKGKSGGKTIIFERLFKFRNDCGYTFKNKSTNGVTIKNQVLFDSYIVAMVKYLKAHPETTSREIDKLQGKFLNKLKEYGFPHAKQEEEKEEGQNEDNKDESSESSNSSNNVQSSVQSSSSDNSSNNHNNNVNSKGTNGNNGSSSGNSGTVKTRPEYGRKNVPAPLANLIKECYDLEQNNFANAKLALTRVTFECTLKYIVENAKQQNGKALSVNIFFRGAYFNSKNQKLPSTNFDYLKNKFAELIIDAGIRKAFESYDLELAHQIIHNYHVSAVPANAKNICDNLIGLIEFMLQDEDEFLESIDLTKLR